MPTGLFAFSCVAVYSTYKLEKTYPARKPEITPGPTKSRSRATGATQSEVDQLWEEEEKNLEAMETAKLEGAEAGTSLQSNAVPATAAASVSPAVGAGPMAEKGKGGGWFSWGSRKDS
ncbi:hypothetical protein HDV00_003583 [Rhizophlyctis rosea]|nr:hypothetical protein HDV00_003583 [Rhizophlyctis rosea]